MGQPTLGPMGATSDSGGYIEGNFTPESTYPGGCHEGGGYSAGCDSGEGYSCGCDSCASSGCDSSAAGWFGGASGTWFVNADYLAVRAHFSEALSYVEQESTNTATTTATSQNFHQLDFDYDNSYRIGGGYRLCCCGEELAFNFTHFTSSADDSITAPDRNSGIVVDLPFNPNPLDPDAPQTGRIRASVDADSYDFEWRKTIPLGGTSCSDCSQPCGCGDCCPNTCPAWDITWSGGIRGARVDWDRAYFLTDPVDDTNNTDTRSELRFNGAGPRVGLEGRRYFGHDGWFSIFMKGDLSILLGQLDLDTVQHSTIVDTDTTLSERFHTQQIIPVTEFEAGASATVTCHSTFSAGYLLSAWHDLGMRDEPILPNQVPQIVSHYDDANILGFDGFFVRYEWIY